jgi:hypothetical protein
MTEEIAIKQDFIGLLRTHPEAFVQVNGTADVTNGWKLSIQGRTLEDSAFLFERLINLLLETKVSFKFGTQALIDNRGEQGTKLLTIYIPNGVTPKSYAELVRLNIADYKGADDIPEKRSYTKYAPGIFFRNDRTSQGDYIPA